MANSEIRIAGQRCKVFLGGHPCHFVFVHKPADCTARIVNGVLVVTGNCTAMVVDNVLTASGNCSAAIGNDILYIIRSVKE